MLFVYFYELFSRMIICIIQYMNKKLVQVLACSRASCSTDRLVRKTRPYALEQGAF